ERVRQSFEVPCACHPTRNSWMDYSNPAKARTPVKPHAGSSAMRLSIQTGMLRIALSAIVERLSGDDEYRHTTFLGRLSVECLGSKCAFLELPDRAVARPTEAHLFLHRFQR